MTAADPVKKLHNLLKRIQGKGPPAAPADRWLDTTTADHDPVAWQFVFSFMAWEAGTAAACRAVRVVHALVVDCNELRVSMPDDIIEAIGADYPLADERARRLRSALNELFRREHAVTFEPLAALPKRDARQYLLTLPGCPAYVASRMMLLCFGGHGFPLDRRIHSFLASRGAIPGAADEAEAEGWLERQLHVGELEPAYLSIESHLDENPPPAPKPRRRAAASGASSAAPGVAERPAKRVARSGRSAKSEC